MFRCFEKDGNLYFEGVKLSPNTLTSYGDLILYVPKDLSLDLFSVSARACNLEVNEITSEEIQCEVGAGLVNFTGVDAGQIVIQLGAGEIDMQDVTSDALLVEVGAGDFELQTGNITKVDLDVGMGNAEIYDIKTDDISAACAMGNIEILIEGSEDDYDYVANCVAGNVSIGNSGGIIIGTQRWDSPGDKKINADCAMGNIEIDFEE